MLLEDANRLLQFERGERERRKEGEKDSGNDKVGEEKVEGGKNAVMVMMMMMMI